MGNFPHKLREKLKKREQEDAFRILVNKTQLIDLSSKDYLGFARQKTIADRAATLLHEFEEPLNGSSGSRLLSGNGPLNDTLEKSLAKHYGSDTALIFNSGYDLNVGFFSSVPQRGDVILYDELCHASIRDGIRMSNAKSYKFKHNDLKDLNLLIDRFQTNQERELYIATESVFSMDGDSPDLQAMVSLCQKKEVQLVVDEAHAVGVFAKGLLHELRLQDQVFARIVTFGKAMGSHGAAVLGDKNLKDFLVNFCRSLIYTTALPPHTLATIWAAHKFFDSASGQKYQQELHSNIGHFKSSVVKKGLEPYFCISNSAIQVCKVKGNEKVKALSTKLEESGFDVRPILSPTVAMGQERLRFCLHAYNSKKEIDNVLEALKSFLIS